MDDDATADGPQIAGDIATKKIRMAVYLYCKMEALLRHLDTLFPGDDLTIKPRRDLPKSYVFESMF